MSDTGNGVVLALGTSNWTLDVVSIAVGGQTLEMLDDSDLSTTGYTEKLAADLVDAGSFSAVCRFNQSDANGFISPVTTAETATITFGLLSGEMVAANLSGTGNVTGGGDINIANNEIMNVTLTFTWDGRTGPSLTAGS
jgi:hypothetical protein